jgi:hypothetical protein
MQADTETARRAIESCAKTLGYRYRPEFHGGGYTVNGRTFHLGEIVRPAACTNPEAMLIVVWFCHHRQACFVKPSDGGRYVGPGLTKIPCDDLLKL